MSSSELPSITVHYSYDGLSTSNNESKSLLKKHMQSSIKTNDGISIKNRSIKESNSNIENNLNFLQMIHNLFTKIMNIIRGNNNANKDLSSNDLPPVHETLTPSNDSLPIHETLTPSNDSLPIHETLTSSNDSSPIHETLTSANDHTLHDLETRLYNKLLDLNNQIGNTNQYKDYCNQIINYLYQCYEQDENSPDNVNEYINDICDHIDTCIEKFSSPDNILYKKPIPLSILSQKIEQEISELQLFVEFKKFNQVCNKYQSFQELTKNAEDFAKVKEYCLLNLKFYFSSSNIENKEYLISISNQIIESLFARLDSKLEDPQDIINAIEIMQQCFNINPVIATKIYTDNVNYIYGILHNNMQIQAYFSQYSKLDELNNMEKKMIVSEYRENLQKYPSNDIPSADNFEKLIFNSENNQKTFIEFLMSIMT